MDPDSRLVVYTTITCGQCWALKHALQRERVTYREIGIENDAEARRFVRRAAGGYMSVPIVVLPNGRILVEPTYPQVMTALGSG